MTRTLLAAALAAALPGTAAAQDDYRHGRVRYAEPGVTLQRAAEPVAEEAAVNVPFLPGDRVWTDGRGRVEFQFGADGFLRVDAASKLDYLDDAGDRLAVRLWSGALYAHGGGEVDLEILTSAGVVATRGHGVYRVDARGGVVALSVYEGEAAFEGADPVTVGEGERLVLREGDTPRVEALDRVAADDFAMWADDRQERVRYARERPADLPPAGIPFYDELYDHGTWANELSLGYVWYPRVSALWTPYAYGRWMWTPYGWTWVAAEPWGWAPFHYGRWGRSAARGWYWIPRGGWSPAWVKWAVGSGVVGWSPLGYHDLALRDPYAHLAVPRGGDTIGLWRYARPADMTRWTFAGFATRASGGEVKVVASPRARLTKDLRVVEGPLPAAAARSGAVPRTRRTAAPPAGSALGQAGRAAGAPAPSTAAGDAPAAAPRAGADVAPGVRRSRPRAEAPATRAERPRSRAEAPGSRGEAPGSRAEAPGSRAEAPGSRADTVRAAPPRDAQPRAAQPRAAPPRAETQAAPRGPRSGGDEGATARKRSGGEERPAPGAARRKDGQ
jgi:hypothetical protein